MENQNQNKKEKKDTEGMIFIRGQICLVEGCELLTACESCTLCERHLWKKMMPYSRWSIK